MSRYCSKEPGVETTMPALGDDDLKDREARARGFDAQIPRVAVRNPHEHPGLEQVTLPPGQQPGGAVEGNPYALALNGALQDGRLGDDQDSRHHSRLRPENVEADRVYRIAAHEIEEIGD